MEDEDLLYGDLNEEALKAPVIEENTNEATETQYLASEKVDSPQFESSDNVPIIPIVPIAMPFLHLYPIDNYTFGSKDALMEIETSYHHRMAQLAESFKAEGMRRTVEAVLLTYQNNHPHVLLLQLGDSTIFKL